MRLAVRFAVESDHVRTDVIDASAFPHLVVRHGVRAVPRTIVDGIDAIDGVLPEEAFLARVLEGVSAGVEGRAGGRRR